MKDEKENNKNKTKSCSASKVVNYKSKRKQDGIGPREVRENVEKVRYNDDELRFIEEARGHIRRAEYIRMMSLGLQPLIVPELNQGAWIELAAASACLNQVAKKLNSGESLGIEEIRERLSQFRAALLGAENSRGAE